MENARQAIRTKDGVTFERGRITLPYDYTTDISRDGVLWLSKYGITKEECDIAKIGFSPRYNRLILPVYLDDELIYWQGRNLGTITKENPKYLNLRNKGAKNVFYRFVCGGSENYNSLCIVEDILSAIKVGRVTNSLALLGSYIPRELYSIIPSYDKIFIWLDEDKYFTALKEAKRMASLTTNTVRTIRTTGDPKTYDKDFIREVLK